jgi:hypothetical protein
MGMAPFLIREVGREKGVGLAGKRYRRPEVKPYLIMHRESEGRYDRAGRQD